MTSSIIKKSLAPESYSSYCNYEGKIKAKHACSTKVHVHLLNLCPQKNQQHIQKAVEETPRFSPHKRAKCEQQPHTAVIRKKEAEDEQHPNFKTLKHSASSS